ncbi:hypothetical protein FNH06_15075 [Amycolatopsis acidiphila]|uniref:Clp R domain-containing protein n=1 Tax=Amycolatopsis acidiphila TaxID=715473 RepID=A0A558AC86_9PSEU|nr:hypothetical protein FNH06_15075 [Amycolatopsis acidiphila]
MCPASGPVHTQDVSVTTRSTDRLRRVFALAEREAVTMGHEKLGTEHLLLGLVREEHDSEGTAGLLAGEGVDADLVRREIAGDAEQPVADARRDSPAFTAAAKAAVDQAAAVSDELVDHTVGVRHLLLGVLDTGECQAVRILHGLGADVDGLRARAYAGIAEDTSARASAGLEPVLSQQMIIMRMLGRVSARLDAIEARLPGDGGTS